MSADLVSDTKTVVLDTNVVLSLYVFADSKFAPLRRLIETGRWRAMTNAACLDEFARVLGYPLFGLDATQQSAALQAYSRESQQLDSSALTTPLPRCTDQDDQKFLELARDSRAECLITGDKALLKLARRLKQAGMFRIITPDVALAEQH